MNTLPTITEQDIRTFVGEQNLLKGQQYVRDGAIVDPVLQGMMLKAYWLKQHYWASNNYTTALELAESMFRRQPSIENYRDMRQLAGYLDRWETLRPEVLSFLKTSRNALVLTQIALDEGDIESALALVKSQARRSSTSRNDRQIYTYDLGYNKVVFDVARVAEDSRPHAAIELYQQHVEALLVGQDRWGYRTACEYLLKIRTLYEKLEDSEG
jgi:uncharacterized Zn finger protein